VLVVEGEKVADAAAQAFPDLVPIAWLGGAQAVAKADWSALQGRRVAIWPDNDQPGRKAAVDVAQAATAAGAAHVALVDVPADWPDGWDLADALPEGVTAGTLRDLLNEAMAEKAESTSPGDRLRAASQSSGAIAAARITSARRDMAQRHRIPVADLEALRVRALRATRQEEAEAEPAAPAGDPRGRADLLIDGADLPDTAAELAKLLAAQPHLFDRGGPASPAISAAAVLWLSR
jgi:DNA primase